MGERTGKEPDGRDTFLWRICHALDLTPPQLAKRIGVRPSEVRALLYTHFRTADYSQDDTWELINAYVNKQLGLLLAVRADLQRSMREDRIRRLQRVEDFERLKKRRRKDVRDTPILNR